MEESKFYSEAVLENTLQNQQFNTVTTQNSGGGFLNKASNVFKQIAIGIDAANQHQTNQYAMQNPTYNFNQYPQNQAAMAYGYNRQRNNTLLWVVGGAVVIGGIAYLAKENIDD